MSSKEPGDALYDGVPTDDGNTRNRTRYLDASQAWFRKLKHSPKLGRKMIEGYEN
jgi:hypothetical protein